MVPADQAAGEHSPTWNEPGAGEPGAQPTDAAPRASGSGTLRDALASGEGIPTRVTLVESTAEVSSPHVHPPPSGGPALGRKYAVVGEIASGGMGIILKCRDEDIGRDVAIKVLHDRYRDDPRFLERFIEEAQINGQLQHPGIVPVYDIGREDRQLFFTMKLIKGRTLAELLAERADLRADRQHFLRVFLQVCQTMAYAHSRRVIHRDLKPSNVMVGAFGEVLVVDWGLARILRRDAESDDPQAAAGPRPDSVIATARSRGASTPSLVGSVMGTPAYMPPEQAAGDIESLDARSDVFSLGGILCEILTGRPPYVAKESSDVVRLAAAARLDEAQRRLAGCGADPELVDLALDCLRPAPLARPRSAGEIADRISRHLSTVEARAHEAQIVAAEERVKASAARRAQRLTLALTFSVLCMVALGTGGYLWVERQSAAQVTQTTRAIDEALLEAARIRGQDPAPQAAEVRRALGVLRGVETLVRAPGVPDALRSRVETLVTNMEREEAAALDRSERAARDERMKARLEEIEIPPDSEVDLTGFDTREALRKDSAFERAFAEYGLDVLGIDPEEAVMRVQESAIRVELTLALESWARARRYLQRRAAARGGGPRADPSSWRFLMEIARDADDDPLRKTLRDSVLSGQFNLRALERLLDLADPSATPPLTLTLLAVSFQRLGEIETGLTLLRRAQLLNPGDFNLNLQFGMMLEARVPPMWSDAVRFYTAALTARPRSLVALHRLGSALQASGDGKGALEVFGEAASLRPQESDWHIHRRRILYSILGDVKGAIAASRRALELDPEDAGEHLALARLYRQSGDYAEAAESYRRCMELKTMTWVVWRALENATRYDAACVAAKAGASSAREGVETPYRAMALDWLTKELRFKRLVLVERSDATRAKIRGQLLRWLSEESLSSIRDEEHTAVLRPEERRAAAVLWSTVREVVAQLETPLPPPLAPLSERPANGTTVSAGSIELQTSPFRADGERSTHAFTLWQVRAADGRYSRNPAYAALRDDALTSVTLPPGLLLARTTYYWRAAHVSASGRRSPFSGEATLVTGDLPWEPLPIDLTDHFDHDVVAEAVGVRTESVDYGEGFLIADGFDGTRAGAPGARGLPADRVVGVHRLGRYDGPNALQFTRGSKDAVRIDVPRRRYVALRFLGTGGNGDTVLPVTIEYTDGSRDVRAVLCDDWFEDIPPNAFGPLQDGVLPVWNGMDRLFAGAFQDTNEAALFETLLPVRSDVEVSALTLDPAGATFDQEITRFTLLAITGVAVVPDRSP